jgi:hypothetical protein
VERSADDHDRAVTDRGDKHDRADMGLCANCGVQLAGQSRELGPDLASGVVAAHRREEMDLGVTVSELAEGHRSPAAREKARSIQVKDLAGPRQRGHVGHLDVLDVSEDSEAKGGQAGLRLPSHE